VRDYRHEGSVWGIFELTRWKGIELSLLKVKEGKRREFVRPLKSKRRYTITNYWVGFMPLHMSIEWGSMTTIARWDIMEEQTVVFETGISDATWIRGAVDVRRVVAASRIENGCKWSVKDPFLGRWLDSSSNY